MATGKRAAFTSVCILIACFAALAALFFTGVIKTHQVSESIKIGVIEPLSGSSAVQGAMELEGIVFANKLYPTVEINGKQVKIELEIADNHSKRLYTREAVKQLITEKNVSLILGSFSSPLSIMVGPVLEKARVPGIVMSATNQNVIRDTDYYFRLCFDDVTQSRNMAHYAYTNLGARTACVIAEEENNRDLAEVSARTFIELTNSEKSVLRVEFYPSDTTDFAPYLARIAALKPDVLFATGYAARTPLIVRTARLMGITAEIVGNSNYDDDAFLTGAAGYTDKVSFVSMFDESHEHADLPIEFIAAYHSEFGKKVLPYVALGADGYFLARRAIESAQASDSHAVRSAIAQMQNFSGVAGPVAIAPDGTMTRNVLVKRIVDNQFETVAENPAPRSQFRN
ncbi:MAG: hypothetical protein Ta2A_14630 [Treponemataceae bacterium]|nr:MAG: hypothetical protein Ta2A_14630 [Treponemataceae bacterium]